MVRSIPASSRWRPSTSRTSLAPGEGLLEPRLEPIHGGAVAFRCSTGRFATERNAAVSTPLFRPSTEIVSGGKRIRPETRNGIEPGQNASRSGYPVDWT